MDSDQSPSATDLDDIETAFHSLTIHSSSNDNAQASSAIGVLANASRWHTETREQLADPKVLRVLVDIVECSINDALETAELALRCIGNACIDNNTASQEVTRIGFHWAKQCLPSAVDHTSDAAQHACPDAAVAMLAAKVLYNICSDFEPAQQQCFEDHLHHQLIPVCAFEEVVTSDQKPLYIELLFWICGHLQPDQDTLPTNVLAALLRLPGVYLGSLQPEDFALLIETCLLFLREPEVQKDVSSHRLASLIWQMLELNESMLSSLEPNHDDRRLLPPLSTALIWILSDVAASAEFAHAYTLDDEWISSVIIPAINAAGVQNESIVNPRLVDAASQVLGNLLWSLKDKHVDATHVGKVEGLSPALLTALSDSEDAELLHSAAGLLVQLLRLSPKGRKDIGEDPRTPHVIERLCGKELPQLKQDGIALLKALGKESSENQLRFGELAKTALGFVTTSDTAMIEQ